MVFVKDCYGYFEDIDVGANRKFSVSFKNICEQTFEERNESFFKASHDKLDKFNSPFYFRILIKDYIRWVS